MKIVSIQNLQDIQKYRHRSYSIIRSLFRYVFRGTAFKIYLVNKLESGNLPEEEEENGHQRHHSTDAHNKVKC